MPVSGYPPGWGTPPFLPRPRRRPGLIAGLSVAVAVAMLGIGGTLVALVLRGHPTAPVAAPSSPAAATPSTCHTIGANGCEDGKTNVPDIFTVRDWFNGGGADHLRRINDDVLAFDSGGLTGSARDARLRARCASLQQDVQAAQAYKPIPDTEAQQAWTATLDAFDRGGADCVAGVDQHDADLIGKATDEFERGGVNFHKVFDRLTALAPK